MQKNTEETKRKGIKSFCLILAHTRKFEWIFLPHEIFQVVFPPILYCILQITQHMTGSPGLLTTVTVLLFCRSEQCVEFLNNQHSDTTPNSLTEKSGKR